MNIRVNVYNQFFKLRYPNLDILEYDLYAIHKELTTYKRIPRFDKFKKKTINQIEVDKRFYIIDHRDRSIRYPRLFLSRVLEHLEDKDIDFKEEHMGIPEGEDIDIEFNKEYVLRDDQMLYFNNITTHKGFSYLIDARTGFGKTVVISSILAHFKKRFMILVLPRYIEKWINDLKHYLNLKDNDIFVVQGSKSLRDLLAMDKNDLKKIKAIICSMKTLNNYINEWLDMNQEFSYEVKPDDLTSYLNIGYIVNDETHQEFHNVFRFNLFLQCKMFIGLTATLISKDSRMNRMYWLLFPKDHRLQEDIEYNRYINVISVKYYTNKYIRYKNNFGYSQTLFEKSIIDNEELLNNYLEMIYRLYKAFYCKKRKDSDKCIIFAGTIEMCKHIRDYIRDKEKDIKITKYTEEEDYSVIEDNDVIVSTILSAGTALDIKNLITVIQTIAVDSIQANKQTIGRLRYLKDKEVHFVYTWCNEIPSHRKYNKHKIEYFADIAKTFKFLVYDMTL